MACDFWDEVIETVAFVLISLSHHLLWGGVRELTAELLGFGGIHRDVPVLCLTIASSVPGSFRRLQPQLTAVYERS